MKRLSVSLLLLLVALPGCRTATLPEPDRGYRIIAYVRGQADIERIGAQKLTHINYAFATVSPEGDMILHNPESPSHLARLQALKAKNPDLKILLSVGGWGADHFSEAALTAESREKFSASGISLVKRYALDGIDVDWEYPGQAGPGISFRPEDRENFTAMLRSLREHLDALGRERGRSYLLTIASAAGRYFEHTEMNELHAYLDWINVMTYDFVWNGAPATGHHTALHWSGPADAEFKASAEEFVRQHLEAGIPPSKIVVGAAFYGRGYAGADPADFGLRKPYERYDRDWPWSRIAAEGLAGSGFERRWDPVAKAPWLWNPATRTFITYDDPDSLREKARYVRELGLGGMMYWEHSHDPNETLLDVLWEELR